jgi:hypothetical protein
MASSPVVIDSHMRAPPILHFLHHTPWRTHHVHRFPPSIPTAWILFSPDFPLSSPLSSPLTSSLLPWPHAAPRRPWLQHSHPTLPESQTKPIEYSSVSILHISRLPPLPRRADPASHCERIPLPRQAQQACPACFPRATNDANGTRLPPLVRQVGPRVPSRRGKPDPACLLTAPLASRSPHLPLLPLLPLLPRFPFSTRPSATDLY